MFAAYLLVPPWSFLSDGSLKDISSICLCWFAFPFSTRLHTEDLYSRMQSQVLLVRWAYLKNVMSLCTYGERGVAFSISEGRE